MSLSFLNPFTLGIMLVVAVGTVAYNIWSTNQQPPNYGYSRPDTTTTRNGPTTGQTFKKDTKKRKKVPLDSLCSICLEKMEVELKTLVCSHTYHYKCITPWLDDKKTCPLCRSLQ